MAILVTGGAGYIGSATVEHLLSKGEKVVVLDDLFRGHPGALEPGVPFYQGKVGDQALIERITHEQSIEECIHFAALAYVGESVADPKMYYENNVQQGTALMGALLKEGVKRIVFSSTCATYGEPKEIPISERCPQWPVNPYGWSKLIVEQLLSSYNLAYGLKFVALRYFNACGATKTRGEFHRPESHLIPNVLAAAIGEKSELSVFGNDYPTPDGTCIRDYVHVSDLADAHIRALDHLRKGGISDFINLGTGDGYSVMEVIEGARKAIGKQVPFKIEPRRPGDPPKLVADASKAATVLGWKPVHSDLISIFQSQWEWQRSHPHGYKP